jgi:hypothetical protein
MNLLKLFAVSRDFNMEGERVPGEFRFICKYDIQLYVWTHTYSPSGHQFFKMGSEDEEIEAAIKMVDPFT